MTMSELTWLAPEHSLGLQVGQHFNLLRLMGMGSSTRTLVGGCVLTCAAVLLFDKTIKVISRARSLASDACKREATEDSRFLGQLTTITSVKDVLPSGYCQRRLQRAAQLVHGCNLV
jgi:hypothetical protein